MHFLPLHNQTGYKQVGDEKFVCLHELVFWKHLVMESRVYEKIDNR